VNPAVARWVEQTRAAQGLGPRVTDPDVLDEITVILTGSRVEGVVVDAKAS
jgi:hypothetical protein